MVVEIIYSEKNIKKIMKKKFSIFILWMIKEKADTGYGLVKRLEDENIRLTCSQLYPLLNSLNKKGYLKKVQKHQGKRKSYIYSITISGEKCFKNIRKMVSPTMKKFCKFLIKR
ncbi:PadR family transcriptional regulator [Candidatus Micrarchaeota archaeon]|jgi:DNA-binding PadR family transcriptional regulator|nr:PadR family transcriptional regulator [Candidatus Micrarchaeota archaeon]